MINKFKDLLKYRVYGVLQKKYYSQYQSKFDYDLNISVVSKRYKTRNAIHAYMHHYYHHLCPIIIREHRDYFNKEQRGFGEDAFHAMWWLLLREYQPRLCLEIGVYRGQVISLWALIAKMIESPCQVHGISPFTPVGDTVSQYRQNIDYLTDTLAHFEHWRLPAPMLLKAFSTEPAAAKHIMEQKWDLIYIDGSHDYEIAMADYRLCRDNLKPGGLLVLDDASVGTSFRPPLFSFAGHPGPSRVVAEYAIKEIRFLCAVGHNNIFIKD